ncbi:Peptidyl-prolyl cis-trans isomerase pin4 [Recurvomyces mirabilis]|uniref:Peptidyl-prolyl cis-trans isomerase pin4 n=1 Tax=Recurvomyces mirabilis TaxID=574656 RepID=A0AAE1C023_9PEZI|nr:Peptidyl-prolyl cis-trans isomerase pin4 [Recurvomyces mirabilis]KAK5151019.1 Peptidyl-prolyl cis-trans isomerase pin4 [Recurvomyces mirabilis]
MNHNDFDMYYNNNSNRSPTSHRQLNRQASRQQVEPQAYLPSDLYAGAYGGDRFNDGRSTIGGYGNEYGMGGATWNSNTFGQNNTVNGLGGTGMRRPQSKGRAGLPAAWIDQSQAMPPPFMGGMAGFGGMRPDTMGSDPDEDLIPTAIVIKNIPFAVKKEQLVAIMTDMGLPLPYAFNYHFDNGVFRGLAFANFTNPDETAAVIDSLNHFELNGRKLRVEYKKMLPAAERERIEREKRERRGQLEEQHRPMGPATLQTQGSMSSLNSRIQNHSPSPVTARNMRSGGGWQQPTTESPNNMGVDVDMNDPITLQYYTKLLLFKEDTSRDLVVFPPTLAPPERRIVHTLAHHMSLGHTSKGEADRRAVHVFKEGSRARVSPPMPQIAHLQNDNRRTINRAATTDFSDVRGGNDYYGGGLRTQGSAYLGGYNDVGSLGPNNNLRAAKSFADLRSYTPSPVPSTASFPAALSNNVARLAQDFGTVSNQSNTPTLMTPTSSLAERNESTLISGLGNMNLGSNGFGGSPRGLRGFPSWDRETPGPIGGHRSFSTNYDDRSQSRNNQQGNPERQPRGPIPERGAGFPRPRQNGHVARNSDEMSQQSSAPEITVEH